MTNELVSVGYFAKRTAVPKGWDGPAGVVAIGSVSRCIGSAPEGWMERWLHNDWGFFASEEEARSSVDGDGYTVFAYRLLPRRFTKNGVEHLEVGAPFTAPLPAGCRPLGFDIVSRSFSAFFECSPLSCNGMAKEIAVNQWCLVEPLHDAVRLAERFAREEPEPGPYYVIEVLGGCAPA
ncbi:MAG: hypothetical protein JNK48_30930 [Bryobacterales bacterium]|nr:hypothetical protein [Bryobacterales bacterium]